MVLKPDFDVLELALMETRCHPRHSIVDLDLRDLPRTDSRCEYFDALTVLRTCIHEDCTFDGLLSPRRWSCWHTSCTNGQNMGKEALVHPRHHYIDILKWMGRGFQKLLELTMG